MAQYFFHLHNGHDVLLDSEGMELDGLAAVTAQALKEARSLISHDALEGRINLHQFIEVESPVGAVVHRLEFGDAVEVANGPA
jgi:hypothetical protein